MALYRQIFIDFWRDPKVTEEMSAEDRYVLLYLLTNPSTTQIGIYMITKRQMAFDLGYSTESVGAILNRFEHGLGLIRYNPDTREIAIKNWGKYNLKRGGKPVLDCIKGELSKVKDKSLIEYVSESIPNESIKNEFLRYVNVTLNENKEAQEEIEDENDKKDYVNLEKNTKNKEMLETSHSYVTSTWSGQEQEQEQEQEKEQEEEEEQPQQKEKEISFVEVVDKVNEYFFLEDEEIKKVANEFLATGEEIDYLVEKLELVKNAPDVKSVVGFLLKAIQNNYKNSIHKNEKSIPRVKTRFHNVNETFNKYTPEQLEAILLESQRGKFN